MLTSKGKEGEDMVRMKNVPYGIGNFEELKKKGFYYHTNCIKQDSLPFILQYF